MSHLIAHPLRRTAALALAVAGVCALGACADDPVTSPAEPGAGDSSGPDTPVTSSPGDSDTTPPTSAPAGDPIAADLTVKVDDGNGTTATYAVTCVPDGGRPPRRRGGVRRGRRGG